MAAGREVIVGAHGQLDGHAAGAQARFPEDGTHGLVESGPGGAPRQVHPGAAAADADQRIHPHSGRAVYGAAHLQHEGAHTHLGAGRIAEHTLSASLHLDTEDEPTLRQAVAAEAAQDIAHIEAWRVAVVAELRLEFVEVEGAGAEGEGEGAVGDHGSAGAQGNGHGGKEDTGSHEGPCFR